MDSLPTLCTFLSSFQVQVLDLRLRKLGKPCYQIRKTLSFFLFKYFFLFSVNSLPLFLLSFILDFFLFPPLICPFYPFASFSIFFSLLFIINYLCTFLNLSVSIKTHSILCVNELKLFLQVRLKFILITFYFMKKF